jgi:hypothetical protein
MIAPPRFVESLLSSLGADPGFRDDLLGDLLEEFNIRAAWDGAVAARWWYYGEALRCAPHLVRSWWSRATARDAKRIGSAVITAITGVFILSTVVGGIAAGLMRALAPTARFDLRHPSLVLFIASITLGMSTTMASGYLAAHMDDETPVASAVTLAIFWATVDLAAFVLAPQRFAWQVVVPFIPLIGATVGGLLCAARRRAPEASSLSPG